MPPHSTKVPKVSRCFQHHTFHIFTCLQHPCRLQVQSRHTSQIHFEQGAHGMQQRKICSPQRDKPHTELECKTSVQLRTNFANVSHFLYSPVHELYTLLKKQCNYYRKFPFTSTTSKAIVKYQHSYVKLKGDIHFKWYLVPHNLWHCKEFWAKICLLLRKRWWNCCFDVVGQISCLPAYSALATPLKGTGSLWAFGWTPDWYVMRGFNSRAEHGLRGMPWTALDSFRPIGVQHTPASHSTNEFLHFALKEMWLPWLGFDPATMSSAAECHSL